MRDTSRLRADIRTHLEAENAYTQADARSAHVPACRTSCSRRCAGASRRMTAPFPPSTALGHTIAASAKAASIRSLPAARPSMPSPTDPAHEQLLLDGEAMAKGCDYWDIRKVSHSPDHRLIAYAIDDKGSEFYTLHVHRLRSPAEELESIPTPMATSSGARIRPPSSGWRATRMRVPSPYSAAGSAAADRRTCLSRSRTPASSSACRRASRAASSSSPPTTTPRPSGASCAPTPPTATPSP